jgi:hypothetical protein
VSRETGAFQNGRKPPGAEPHAQGLAAPVEPAHKEPAVHAVHRGAGFLERKVHVRVRQDLLLVRRLTTQVPSHDPVEIDERLKLGRRWITSQREPGCGHVLMQHTAAQFLVTHPTTLSFPATHPTAQRPGLCATFGARAMA